ncbi:MAG: stage III sporulation protein AB [Oscillospiraceae bacterium]|jgi:stage III sporulation protein AB|nr:stage III sporulation protein AB [Oscillospiraceae bacterium]
MRILGITLLSACAVYTGFLISKSYICRLEYLKKIHKMLFEIKGMIQFRELKIYEIFSRLDYELEFIHFKQNGNFFDNWEESVNKDKNLYTKEKTLLLQFGRELGTTDTAGQIAIINLYLQYFKTLIDEMSLDIAKKTKSYRAMGIFFASIIFIIGV